MVTGAFLRERLSEPSFPLGQRAPQWRHCFIPNAGVLRHGQLTFWACWYGDWVSWTCSIVLKGGHDKSDKIFLLTRLQSRELGSSKEVFKWDLRGLYLKLRKYHQWRHCGRSDKRLPFLGLPPNCEKVGKGGRRQPPVTTYSAWIGLHRAEEPSRMSCRFDFKTAVSTHWT